MNDNAFYKPNTLQSVKCPYCGKEFKNFLMLQKHFRKNHKNLGKSKEEFLADVYYNGVIPTCKCGCGKQVTISYEGGAHFNEYIRGHASRIYNNWGNNEKAKIHSAETRRKQYKSGERIQWNKGKKWNETYSDEKIKELENIIQSPTRKQKISKALKGKKKSPEAIAAYKKSAQKLIPMQRERMRKRLSNGEFHISSKLENDFIEKYIKPLNIEYETQHYISEIHQYCDVYFPSKNLIIEINGDYWHYNPMTNKKAPTSYQLERIQKDKMKDEYCEKNHIKLLKIWEHDIKKNLSNVLEIINENVKL